MSKGWQREKQEQKTVEAILYARRGWQVFPVGWKKTPKTANGFYDATTDEEQMAAWFLDEYPEANVGIRTGRESGIWVLDIDMKDGKDGVQAVNDWLTAQGMTAAVPDTLMARTPTGGYHWYFRWDPAYEVGTNKDLLAGVDVRGEGGYVVAPPSVAHVGGAWKEYRWNDFRYKRPIEAPDWAYEIAGLRRAGNKKSKPVELARALGSGIPKGSRDDDLFLIAALCNRQGVSREAAQELIVYLHGRCEQVESDRFTVEDALAKVESAYSYSSERFRQLVREAMHEQQDG